jgi:hypothetical protein
MKRFTLLASLLAMGILYADAQGTVENVYRINRRSSDAIREGTDVKGYYFFYASDKIDKKTYEWTLEISDNNLKTLKTIKFIDSKDVTILESSFNGSDLIFLFYNEDAKTFEYQIYGADGKKKFIYNRELTKKEKRYLEMTYLALDDEDQTYKGLYPIEGKGFISNMPSREDKDYTFQVDYFSSEKRKQWTFTPTIGGKKFIGDYLGYFNGVVYFEVLKFSGMLDGNPDSYILGLNLETGKQVFEKPTDGKHRFYPASMSIIGGKAYLYGEYFNPGGNISKDKSLGFAFWGIDEKGAIQSEKYCAWDLELGKYLNVTSKGKIDDFGFMFLHNIIQTADGSIYAIGEGYKKVASALGILSQVASGGRSRISTLKIKVTDMILIRFDKDFNVKEARIYDKNPNTQELPSGYEFVSTPLLGKMIKYHFGEFDYAYTQTNKDLTSFTVTYADYVRGKDYKGGTFNSISYNDGKITTDRINTKSDAKWTIVLPGKQGQVLLVDYFKKEKRLDKHFEKLN